MKQLYPVVKSIISPDIDNLPGYLPDEPDCFGIFMQVIFGLRDIEGGESFDLTLCTPLWLEKEMKQDDIRTGRHFLLVKRYDYSDVVKYLHQYSLHCAAETWEEVAHKLSYLGHWEFADYPG